MVTFVLEDDLRREEVVTYWTQMNPADQDQVRLLIAAASKGTVLKESILATVIMVGAGFIIHSYIPAEISSQTGTIASDLSSAKTDIANLKTSVSSVQSDVSGIRNDVKEILKDALKGAFKKVAQVNASTGDPRELRAGLQQGSAALVLAREMTAIGATLDADQVARFGLEATKVIGNPALNDDAWRATALSVNYTSTSANQDVDWIGPVMPFENGFPGLFGITEMAGVRIFGSKKLVPLQQASVLLTFRSESRLLPDLKAQCKRNIPRVLDARWHIRVSDGPG